MCRTTKKTCFDAEDDFFCSCHWFLVAIYMSVCLFIFLAHTEHIHDLVAFYVLYLCVCIYTDFGRVGRVYPSIGLVCNAIITSFYMMYYIKCVVQMPNIYFLDHSVSTTFWLKDQSSETMPLNLTSIVSLKFTFAVILTEGSYYVPDNFHINSITKAHGC
jgi:hypothetical protein